jgi:hypothetical protein
MRRGLLFTLTMGALLTGPGEALAHDLGATCRLRGDLLEVEAYFDDDTVARGAKVQLLDPGKKVIAQGKTDVRGLWSCPRPDPGVYQVTVNAGAGHVTRTRVTIPAPGEQTSSAESGKEPPARPKAVDGDVVSEGPSRDEFVRFPWVGLLIGLGVIAAAGLGLWLLINRRGGADPTG